MPPQGASDFQTPTFDPGEIELRFTGGEVCIYATLQGLTRLIGLLSSLAEGAQTGHLHLTDYELLTPSSLPGVVAVFPGHAKAKTKVTRRGR